MDLGLFRGRAVIFLLLLSAGLLGALKARCSKRRDLRADDGSEFMAEPEQAGLTTLTVELLSAFVSNNTIESDDLAGLIQTTHAALAGIDAPLPPEPAAPEYQPAVTIRKSLGSRDHILSLIDGKPYKTLKRHLSGHGLTPSEYRERYKLPADYPMVAPSYSDQRRDVAQRLGLGRKSKVNETEAVTETKPAASAVEAPPSVTTPAETPDGSAPESKAAKAPTSKSSAKPAPKRVAKTAAAAPAALADGAATADPAEPVVSPGVAKKKPAPAKSGSAKPKAVARTSSKTVPKPTSAKRGRSKADVSSAPTE